MAYIAFTFAAALSALLWSISAMFRPHFSGHDRVMMQWGFDKNHRSYAAPKMTLAFTPAIGTLVLFGIASLITFATPSKDQSATLPIIVVIGIVLVTIHALHMRFAAKVPDDQG